MKFEKALKKMRKQAFLTRENWEGDVYVFLATTKKIRQPGYGVIEANYKIGQFLCMKTADDKFVPWVPNAEDLLTTDWIEVDLKEAGETEGDEIW